MVVLINAEDYKPFRSKNFDFKRKFICLEESTRYSGALEQMVFNRLQRKSENKTIVEFGSGTGFPVISALMNGNFLGQVHGFEINPEAAATGRDLIDEFGLSRQYTIHSESFFDAPDMPKSDYLIANPPYVPSRNRDELTLPDLCGGEDGNEVSKDLLSLGYKNALLLVSSYSNPIDLLHHAKRLGYIVDDFQITKMSFGVYSRQPCVQKRIREMKDTGKAFFTENCYLLGAAFFTKEQTTEPDLSVEFLRSLTALM